MKKVTCVVILRINSQITEIISFRAKIRNSLIGDNRLRDKKQFKMCFNAIKKKIISAMVTCLLIENLINELQFSFTICLQIGICFGSAKQFSLSQPSFFTCENGSHCTYDGLSIYLSKIDKLTGVSARCV